MSRPPSATETSTAEPGALVRADVAAFADALGKVTATCPVPNVTLQTIEDCKTTMRALVKTDETILGDFQVIEAPTALQPKLDAVRTGLRDLDAEQSRIIRTYIDKGDIKGFKAAGGLGSPIDNAINATKDALAELQLLVASSGEPHGLVRGR